MGLTFCQIVLDIMHVIFLSIETTKNLLMIKVFLLDGFYPVSSLSLLSF